MHDGQNIRGSVEHPLTKPASSIAAASSWAYASGGMSLNGSASAPSSGLAKHPPGTKQLPGACGRPPSSPAKIPQ